MLSVEQGSLYPALYRIEQRAACRSNQSTPMARTIQRRSEHQRPHDHRNDTGFSVVGMMPAHFEFPKGVDIWSPLSGSIGGGALQNRQAVFLQAVGRLKPG
jgi:hypothetical protein